MSLLAIDGLTVVRSTNQRPIISEVSLTVEPGEIVGIVGESGAGKTTLGLAALGRLAPGLDVRAGEVRHRDGPCPTTEVNRQSNRRGPWIGFVSQHPASALNPALRIGTQLSAMLTAHSDERPSSGETDPRRHVLRAVELPDSDGFMRRYPHQLSGGQMQRLAIAIVLVGDPDVVVLDEPTSGLDTGTGARVLGMIRRLSDARGLAVVCISHDLALVADIADRIVVLESGLVVEEGSAGAVLADPAHPYTRHLVAAIPERGGRRAVGLRGRPSLQTETGCRFANRCDLVHERCRATVPDLADVAPDRRARCVEPFAVPHRLRMNALPSARHHRIGEPVLALREVSAIHGGVEVLSSVSLDVQTGEWLAIVGTSGAGKTTIIRTIAGVHEHYRGTILLEGEALSKAVRRRMPEQRRKIQTVSQHPYESFNPRRVVGDSIVRPVSIRGSNRADARRALDEALDMVSLDRGVARCFPDELSGGELQRAAIARAIIGRPLVLLCDEITASLDSVVRVAIVELLERLRDELGLTIVFVGHDLGLVEAFSDRTAVIATGALVEVGATTAVFGAPTHALTRALIERR